MHTKRVSPQILTGSAATARARLMHDPATRHHTRRAQTAAVPPQTPKLSAADQKRQVLHVLRSFDHFHLADLFYDAAQQTTTAIIRPALDHHDVPHTIQIDAQGNLLVTRLAPDASSSRWRDWQNKLFSGMVLAVLFFTLLALT